MTDEFEALNASIFVPNNEYRFGGSEVSKTAHLFAFEECVKWMSKRTYEPTAVCGTKFRPSWMGTMLHKDLDELCRHCRLHIGHIEKGFQG